MAEEKQSAILIPKAILNKASKKKRVQNTRHEKENNPLYIKHQLQKGNSLIHQLLIYVPDNTDLSLIEEFGEDSGEEASPKQKEASYWNTLTRVHMGKNSSLRYLSLRNYSKGDYHFQRFFSEQKRDSRILYALAHCGGDLGKGFEEARLLEKNAVFRGVGIYAGSNKEFHDIEMLAEHCDAHTRSSLLYKTIVREKAHSVFDARLKIKAHIKDVDSRQINHNLLLDPHARAESMPRLTVKAENVSCEHGATVGMLDPDAIFYLLSRGLKMEEARALMIEGFLSEVIQEFPLTEEREREKLLLEFKKKLRML